MKRKDFGDWGGQADDQTFWRAVAMLGVIGGLGVRAPRNVGEAEEIVDGSAFPVFRAEPSAESPGPFWYIDEAYMESARRGELVDAGWLATQWQAHREGSWYVRLQGSKLFPNRQEIAAALKEQAGAALYSPLPT